MEGKKIKLGIPKGSLQEHTLKIFKLAGFDIGIHDKRGYFLKINDPEIGCFLLRPQEIPKYVEEGGLDLGVSGDDWILESRAKVVEVSDLKYAKKEIKKVKWVLAVSQNSNIRSAKDLEGKTISTEIVNLTKDYLRKNKVKAKVIFSYGATEAKPPKFADAIVDLTETGASLKANNLKVLDVILESSTKLIANKKSWQDSWKKEKIKAISILLNGAVNSEQMVSLMMHVPAENIEKILKVLPEIPTLTKIRGGNWYDFSFRCNKKETRVLIPKLKRMECRDIIELPLIKLIP